MSRKQLKCAVLGAIVSGLALIGACSALANRDRDHEQQLETFLKYAQPPVKDFVYFGGYKDWKPLGHYQLVVWTGINDAYLLTVGSPCQNLEFQNHIGLTSTAHTVSVHFDAVLSEGWRCMIQEIRPIDYRQMSRDLRKQHEDQPAQKTGAPN
jgi:hypothetical protein